MKIYFYDSRALVRVLAAGRTVWCAETGEGFLLEGGDCLNHARRVARAILDDNARKTFFFVSGKK